MKSTSAADGNGTRAKVLAQVLILRFRLHGGLQLSSWGEGNGAAIPKTDGLHKTTLGDTRRELTKRLLESQQLRQQLKLLSSGGSAVPAGAWG